MIICPQCGGSFPESETFCPSCGYAAPEVESPTTDTTPDDAANPNAVGARTTNALLTSETEARDVPSNILAAIKMCVVRGGLKGRSSRAEFWSWIIFVFILLLFVLTLELTEVSRVETTPQENAFWEAFWNLAGFSGIVVLLLTFTLSVRRFHDVNFIGIPAYIFLFLSVVCILCILPDCFFYLFDLLSLYGRRTVLCGLLISFFAILIVALIPGTKGPNRYGPPPVKRKTSQRGQTQNGEVSQ